MIVEFIKIAQKQGKYVNMFIILFIK